MKNLELKIKYSHEDIVYTTKQVNLEVPCHICEGNRTIEFNEKTMKCPECSGKGKFTSNKKVNVVCDEPFKITRTKISLSNSGLASVKYKGSCGFTTLNRAESNLFSTKEEAQAKCDELNQAKAYVDLWEIEIPESFTLTHPSINKIQDKLSYYRLNSKFDKPIVINKDKVLQDGYINYLLCGLLSINSVMVVINDNKIS